MGIDPDGSRSNINTRNPHVRPAQALCRTLPPKPNPWRASYAPAPRPARCLHSASRTLRPHPAPRPSTLDPQGYTKELRPGDWRCAACGAHPNFASRSACYKCSAPKPSRDAPMGGFGGGPMGGFGGGPVGGFGGGPMGGFGGGPMGGGGGGPMGGGGGGPMGGGGGGGGGFSGGPMGGGWQMGQMGGGDFGGPPLRAVGGPMGGGAPPKGGGFGGGMAPGPSHLLSTNPQPPTIGSIPPPKFLPPPWTD